MKTYIIHLFKKKVLIHPLFWGCLILFITAFFSTGYDFADEHFQILEIANYKAGNTTASTLPWEFHSQMRPGLQPAIAYTVIITCNLFNICNPFIISLFLRFLSAVIMVFTIFLLTKAFISYTSTQLSKNNLYLLSFFIWFLPYNFVRFSSENWSGMAFMLGIAFYLLNKGNKINYSFIFIGLLTGLSFVFRYQSAFMIIGLGLWMIIIGKESFKRILLFAGGNILAIIIGIIIDRWLYGVWILSFWNYFDLNILQDKVSEFGILPWWFYFENIFIKATPPIGLAIILSFLYFWYKHSGNIVSWITVPFVVTHLLIGHKELRFLYPLLLLLPYCFTVVYSDLQKSFKYKNLLQNMILKKIIYLLIGLNLFVLLVMCFKPADELISLYKCVYDRSLNKNSKMIIIGDENPFLRGGKKLLISFYKSKTLSFINIQNDSALNDSLLTSDNSYYFLAVKNFNVNHVNENHHLKITEIYKTYPTWVGKFNINNWMSRTNTWSLYEVRKIDE
ncbi:MAG: hypothetical protein NTZ33_00865 [Bacteroidetes bacterium]|nr:hypothetical protein [Bacteroidota bacterium]